jgi:hypothetical protein
MEGAILELDAIRLAAMEKLDGFLVNERHVSQIQNNSLPGCFYGKQLLKLPDVLRCLDPATECEKNLTIPYSPSS